jgi:hypothetical protein
VHRCQEAVVICDSMRGSFLCCSAMIRIALIDR